MRKLLVSLLAVLFLASCGNPNQYVIEGTVADVADGTKVNVYADRRGKVLIESTEVQQGKFTIAGEVTAPEMKFVKVEGLNVPNSRPWPIVIEPKAEVKVSYDGKIVSITGTALNDKNTKFWQELGAKSEPDSQLVKTFVKENVNNILGVYLFEANAYLFDLEELEEMLALVPAEFKDNAGIVKLQKKAEGLKKTSKGKMFTDIKGKNQDGKEVALSDYAGKGKVVLIDFWASWCPYCISDMPFLVDAYAKYKEKGFEIVGVTLDDDVEAWKSGIEKTKITWPQMSDLKGWESELSTAYAVSGLPHVVLIDKDGTIIDRGFGGKELDAKLAELFK